MKANVLCYLLIILSCLSSTSALAQHNEYKISDTLYPYMVKVQNNLKVKGTALNMLDTLYSRACAVNDVKAQCIALYFRVKYYYYIGDSEGQRKEFARVAPYILQTPYHQYYFGAWSNIIIDYINKAQYTNMLTELAKYQERAFALKDGFGIMNSYMILGDFYMGANYYTLALPQYQRALEYSKKNNITDNSTVYSRFGQCCMWLRRWDDAEKALLKSISAVSDEMKMIQPYSVLLSTYCRSDVIDSAKVNRTYQILQRLTTEHPLLGTHKQFYNSAMFDYYKYYRRDKAKTAFYQAQITSHGDSLTSYRQQAEDAEKIKDYKTSASFYKSYGDYIDQVRLKNERFLLSSFVPQVEYQKLNDEKDNQLRHQAKMRLEEAVDNELLLSLNDERDRAKISQRLKEKNLLRNKLEIQRLTWKQREKLLQQTRLKAEQRRKISELHKEKEYWRNVFFAHAILALLILMGIYMFNQYRLRKRLKREKEKAERSEQMKSLFFQNMNHEIRSPLNAIIGFNEVLNSDAAKSLTESEKADFVSMIETNSNLLIKLVNDVLDLSNFEGGTYKLSPADVDIHQLCHTTLESIRGRENKGVQLLLKTPSNAPFMLRTDAQRLQQVLTNFLTNACKYTEKGSITLSYEVVADIVRFAVTDTGRGVKTGDAEKVFERFQMLDKAKRGTGLGLHICQIISKLLHGRVYVDTNYTGGARFVFDHPLKSLLTILIAVCCSFLPAKAQNNPLQIHDNLYRYYLKVDKALNLPQGGAMTDTLFNMAQRSGDMKAQCIAMMLKTKHYRYGRKDAPLLNSLGRCKSFCIAHKQYKYAFKAWGYAINYFLYQNRFKEALHQLQQYQVLMHQLNDSYGIAMYFYEVGNFYLEQQQNATALSYYLKSLRYWTDDKRSIYTLIGQSYFLLKDYQNAILYAKKALALCHTDIARINPTIILTRCYCLVEDVPNAKAMVKELVRLRTENEYRMSFANFYNALYDYYYYIKKDKEKAMEAMLASGNKDNPEHVGNYYYSIQNYETSNKYYKDYAQLSTQWLRKDLGNLFDSYISRFDFDQTQKERQRIELANIQLQLKGADRRKRLLLMQREKSIWELQRADIATKQNKSALDLQTLLLEQQQSDIDKQRILNAGIENQRQMDELRAHWRLGAISFSMLLILASCFVLYRYLRRKAKRLRRETIVAEATERAKNRFYQRVNEKIHNPLYSIVSLNRQLNSADADNLSEIEKSDMMRRLAKSSKSLHQIVNNVLDISKLESGTYKMQVTEINVDELCKLAIQHASSELPRSVRMLFLPQKREGGEPLMICTDESRLHFILSTYLDNACHHTLAGSITLAYELLPDKIRFSVTDTGRVLYAEEAAMIFSRYLSDNREHSLGLGLYLVRLSANLLHGKAYADTSGTVNGARFYLEIPR